jgi:hypothetical protein
MRYRPVDLFTAVVLLIPVAAAQSPDAVLTGAIADPSGAAIAEAAVSAAHEATGVVTRTKSNDAGVYVFPSLPPGDYTLRVEQPGFRPLVSSGVKLEIGARISLNLTLPLGEVAQSVEVNAASDTQLALESSSVGGVLNGKLIEDLPIPGRSAFSLLYTQAGLLGDNVSGTRRGSLAISLDGVNVQDQRLNQGVSSPIFMSTDKVAEFRLISSPADAEYGRGSAQIQMLTRSGTNRVRGSLFWTHRNTVLNANNWFNNQRGDDPVTGRPLSPRDTLIRNQYGGRVGGPIRRNRTFFHFVYDGQKIRERNAVTQTVLTETARQGIFRFFPGARNGSFDSLNPVVDLAGNPVRPANATGALESVSLFNRDPNRSRPDPTGQLAPLLALTPLPNNFRAGDGLNTAGYSWSRPLSQNLWQANVKIDHNLNGRHRLAFAYTYENRANFNGFSEQNFPAAPAGNTVYHNRLYTLNVWSTVRPNMLNEFRAGVLRPWLRFYTGWETEEGRDIYPQIGGGAYLPVLASVTDPLNGADNPVGRISPLYQFSDNLTWIRGKHSLKTGFEVRFSSSNGFNSADVFPRVNFGTGGQPVLNLNSIPGIGQNLTGAINLLNDLTGSVASVVQALNSPGGTNPSFVPGEVKQRTWKRKEFGVFVKDDWKVTPNLTLNLGVRWDYYGVPYAANGKTAALVGGAGSLFGISGSSFADAYQPGRMNGQLTRVELIGPGTSKPNRQLHGDDWNNFGPAVGLSWKLPFFRQWTVLRLGYSIAYERNSLRIADVVSGDQPGLRERVVDNRAGYFDLRAVTLPLRPAGNVLDLVPLTDRTQIVRSFEDRLRNPYIQNFNISIQRQMVRDGVLEVRYVGSKGTRLVRGASVNETVIFENGILDAFLITQQGGHAPLLDRIFMGLNVAGVGRVDGVNITGSDAVRGLNTTQSHLAFHNVGTFADYLSSTNQFTGERGGLLRRAGLPENFVYVNPQFASARLTGNFANSTWHSMQVEFTKRFSRGWTWQGNWTWSKTLGEEEGDGEEMIDSYRDLRNRALDKRLLASHRTHIFRSSGTYELPLRRLLARGTQGWLQRATEGWQIGSILNLFSGEPVYVSSGRSSWNTFGDNTPLALGPLDKALGEVVKQGNGVFYFTGLRQVADPSRAQLTTAGGVRARSTLQAIAGPDGNLLLANPVAGTLGTLAPNFLSGPGAFRLDINLIKRIRVAERKTMELRADAINLTNTPQFGTPNADINSLNFGRISGASGERLVVLGLRVNF